MFDWMIATMIPKMPSADAKISTIKIFTNRLASWASARAQLLPATPTDTLPAQAPPAARQQRTRRGTHGIIKRTYPLAMLEMPTLRPALKTA